MRVSAARVVGVTREVREERASVVRGVRAKMISQEGEVDESRKAQCSKGNQGKGDKGSKGRKGQCRKGCEIFPHHPVV